MKSFIIEPQIQDFSFVKTLAVGDLWSSSRVGNE
ncbi:hypothetical protein FHU13_001237 [Methylobacterium sp. R2-1]|nr:hypothetical protein [Methylobacterium sp. R2-1]